MVRVGVGEEAAVSLNLVRLESVLRNAGATCEDLDDRRGALFCANCGRHDDDCPCEECTHDRHCNGACRHPDELAERNKPHRCDLTRALEEVREALRAAAPSIAVYLSEAEPERPRHLHRSLSDPTPLCGCQPPLNYRRVHYTKARKTDCIGCRTVLRESASRPPESQKTVEKQAKS